MKMIGFLLIGICLTGCATTRGVVQSKERGKGTSKVYPVNTDEAWEIVKTVFRWEETEDVEDHRAEGYMLARSGDSLTSWGTVMGVWIEPVRKDKTKVTVVVKRKNPGEILPPLTEASFHDDFEMAARMRAGRSFSPVQPAVRSPSAPLEEPATSKAVAPSASTDVVTVTWTFANIRSGAGDDFSLVATVKQGDRLRVIGEDGDWFNVRLENGQEGWINNKKVR
jgi:hypothetical protein